jgi:glucokinase
MMAHFIGVDMGGTNLKAGVVDTNDGAVSGLTTIPTLAHEGPQAVMHRMAGLVQSVAAHCQDMGRIQGIGIGVPGVLDLEHGLTLFLPNLPGAWPDVPLRDTIARLTGLTTVILNDARSITFGEWRFGAGRGVETIACFAIGTGIGGGLVIDGKLHLGIGGTGGELGHQVIDFNGPQCGCGNRGCLEVYASGPAIAAMGAKAVLQGLTTKIGAMVDYDLNRITPELICQAAQEGDAIARGIYELAGMYIGVAAANLCVVLGPQRIVIAGGVAKAGELLLDPIRRTVRERVKVMPVEQVEIMPSKLGVIAGVIGAALWASDLII